jgi:aminobenzoyl-glutamate utilization protein B
MPGLAAALQGSCRMVYSGLHGGSQWMSEINTSGLKARVIEAVNEHAKLAQVINDSLFSFGEPGFHEYETSKYLTATLEQHGFAVQRGVASITYMEQLGIVYPTLERPS